MGEGQLARLADGRGTTLRVGCGTLWVTQTQSRDDVVLAAGHVWTVEHNGLTVIEAQAAAACFPRRS